MFIGKPCEATKNVVAEMGIYIYASGGTSKVSGFFFLTTSVIYANYFTSHIKSECLLAKIAIEHFQMSVKK